MGIKVKGCCHSPNSIVRYDAGVGDIILIRRRDSSYVEAKISTILSAQSILVIELGDSSSVEKEVSIDDVAALMLGG